MGNRSTVSNFSSAHAAKRFFGRRCRSRLPTFRPPRSYRRANRFCPGSPVAGDDVLGHGLLQRCNRGSTDAIGMTPMSRASPPVSESCIDRSSTKRPKRRWSGVEASTAREIEQACLCLQLLHGHEFPTLGSPIPARRSIAWPA